jgi:calcineurin-like phosphoesterase family protein
MFKITYPIDFFWSDLHLGHRSVLLFHPDRPGGDDIDLHDEILISNWNNTVGKNDTAAILGDFSYKVKASKVKEYLSRMNGKIHFVRGNHDIHFKDLSELPSNVVALKESLYLENQPGEDVGVYCSHYPAAEWAGNRRNGLALFGHSHGNYKVPESFRMLDVGVDPIAKWNGYFPVSWEQIKGRV